MDLGQPQARSRPVAVQSAAAPLPQAAAAAASTAAAMAAPMAASMAAPMGARAMPLYTPSASAAPYAASPPKAASGPLDSVGGLAGVMPMKLPLAGLDGSLPLGGGHSGFGGFGGGLLGGLPLAGGGQGGLLGGLPLDSLTGSLGHLAG